MLAWAGEAILPAFLIFPVCAKEIPFSSLFCRLRGI
jgi:hypothetical protein